MARPAIFCLAVGILITAIARAHAAQVFVPNFSIGNDYVQWYYGCGPTAGGSIFSYWDRNGYGNLIQGSVDSNVASTSHIRRWYENPIVGDRGNSNAYSTADPLAAADTDDCIADFMGTSRYTDTMPNLNPYNLTNGGTYAFYTPMAGYRGISTGMVDYAAWRGYTITSNNLEYVGTGDSSLTWGAFTAQIDAGKPVIFLVDSNGDGTSDHFVPVFGYDTTGNQYFAYDEWGTTGQVGNGGRWETFQGMGPAWGVGIMTTINGFAGGGAGATPEPAAALLACLCLSPLLAATGRRTSRRRRLKVAACVSPAIRPRVGWASRPPSDRNSELTATPTP